MRTSRQAPIQYDVGLAQDFAIKFNSNAFKLSPESPPINIGELASGESKQARINLTTTNEASDIDSFPFVIETALKTNLDMFIFSIPCSLSVVMQPGFSLSVEKYQELSANPNNKKKLETLANSLDLDNVPAV